MVRLENWNPPTLEYRKAVFTWDTEYAAQVHEGAGENYPARPWVDNAIAQLDLEQEFSDGYREGEDLNKAFLHLTDMVSEQCLYELENPVYDWPRETRRRSGDVVTSPRDIYDLGNLYDSQSVELEETL